MKADRNAASRYHAAVEQARRAIIDEALLLYPNHTDAAWWLGIERTYLLQLIRDRRDA